MKTIYPRFYITPTHNIAIVSKVGSSSLNSAILTTYYPEKITISVGAPIPHVDMLNRARSPKTHRPNLPVLMLVRDPIERFRSACTEVAIVYEQLDPTEAEFVVWVDQMLDKLETVGMETRKDYHFCPQVNWLYAGSTIKLYSYPADMDAIAAEAGLPVPLPVINSAEDQDRVKPVLTASQIARVEAFYADDIALFSSISEVGQELIVGGTPEPESEPEPVYVPNEVTNFQIKQALNTVPEDRAAVDALVAGSADQNTIDGWAHAAVCKRDHALVQGPVADLGWSQEKVDDYFKLAVTFS